MQFFELEFYTWEFNDDLHLIRIKFTFGGKIQTFLMNKNPQTEFTLWEDHPKPWKKWNPRFRHTRVLSKRATIQGKVQKSSYLTEMSGKWGCVSKPSEQITLFGLRELIRHAVLKMSRLGLLNFESQAHWWDIQLISAKRFFRTAHFNEPVKNKTSHKFCCHHLDFTAIKVSQFSFLQPQLSLNKKKI